MKKKTSETFDFSKTKAVIFDMDGTLYNERRLQWHMAKALGSYYVFRPHRWKELLILIVFRHERERHTTSKKNLERAQYQWTATRLQVSDTLVRRIVQKWILENPIPYISRCRYQTVIDLFHRLRKEGKRIAVVSEYPLEKKMRALELSADVLVCCTDKDINRFKPDPKAFLYAADRLYILPSACLVIGDREDKDGEGARRAGMGFLNVSQLTKAVSSLSGKISG